MRLRCTKRHEDTPLPRLCPRSPIVHRDDACEFLDDLCEVRRIFVDAGGTSK